MAADTVKIEALFYNPAERRDPKGASTGGRWTAGGSTMPSKAGGPAAPSTNADASKYAGVRQLGGLTPGVSSMAEENQLREQCAKALALRKCSAFDTNCLAQVAKENGLDLLAEHMENIAPANLIGLLHDSMAAEDKYQKVLPPDTEDWSDFDDSPIITANIGITANRGAPASNVEVIDDYYRSTRYRGWLTDLRVTAGTNNVQIQDVVKAAGIWEGAVEPSASVWLHGTAKGIKNTAMQMGAEYNQDGVMTFTAEPDNKIGAVYTVPGLAEADRDKAIEAMGKHGVMGGRILTMKGGGYALEVADEDGSLFDSIQELSKDLGKDAYATPGTVTFLSNGTDYNKHPRQKKGRGVTHATKSMQQEMKFSKYWAWFDNKGSKEGEKAPKTPAPGSQTVANEDKPALKDWGRDQKWAEAGLTVNPLPKGMALMHMRGGHLTDAPTKGDKVEVYTEEGEWQKGLVALTGVKGGEQGGPYDGQMVVWVGTEGGAKLTPAEGQELPASVVRKAGGSATSMNKRDQAPTGKPGQGKQSTVDSAADGKADKGAATFSLDIAEFVYNPLEPRVGKDDPHGGQWTAQGGGGAGATGLVNPGMYHRAHEDVSGIEGPDNQANPMIELTKGQETKTGPAKIARYGLSQQQMMGEMERRVSKADVKAYIKSYQWYGEAGDLAEDMAAHTKTNMTKAAMTLAATSPLMRWGGAYNYTHKTKTVNQQIAYQILDVVGNHGDDVVDVTDQVVATVKAKWPKLDLASYNGRDFSVATGANLLGKHKMSELPAEAIAALKPTGTWGSVLGDSVVNGIIAAKTGDPRSLGGNKTRSFYNNIRFSETSDDVTIDTFMVKILSGHNDIIAEEAAELSKDNGSYKIMADALRAEAKKMGVLPHMLQAALWEQEHQAHIEAAVPEEDTGGFYKRHILARQQRINEQRRKDGLAPIVWEEPAQKAYKAAHGTLPDSDKAYWHGKFFEAPGTVLPADKNKKPL